MPKICILSSASGGGGGIAAKRVFEAIESVHTDKVDFLTMQELGSINQSISPQLSGSNNIKYNTHFTIEYSDYEIRSDLIDKLSIYDVINIHWCSYLISVNEIYYLASIGKKIVITMHDFYYALDGSHYPYTSQKYQTECFGRSDQLDYNKFPYYSPHLNFLAKRRLLRKSNVKIVAPSQFLISFF